MNCDIQNKLIHN